MQEIIYKEPLSLLDRDRVVEITNKSDMPSENENEGDEFIEIYQQLEELYQNKDQNQKEIEQALTQLSTLVIFNNQILSQTIDAFIDLEISKILLDIVFVNTDLSPRYVSDTFDIINHYIMEDDFRKEFENQGILDFLIEGINTDEHNWDHVSSCLKILTSFIYKNSDFSPDFFNQYHFQISKLNNSFFYDAKKIDNKNLENLVILVTNFYYTLSFLITSLDEAEFMYTYVNEIIHRKFKYNSLFILYILKNVTPFEQILDSIYKNQLILDLMNNAFISENINIIRPAIYIVHVLIENGYNVSDTFNLYNFFTLLDQDDNEIIEESADFISHSLTINPLNPELQMIGNITIYFYRAFHNANYTLKVQLVKTLFVVLNAVNNNILYNMVKNHVVRILVLALDFEDNEVVVKSLQNLRRILDLDPIYDEKQNNIFISDFEKCNGFDLIEQLDFNDQDIEYYAHEFIEKFEEVDEMNEYEERY